MTPWDAAELSIEPSAFSGEVRLFPLPNLVLYPHVMQPLHIFEGRYREMVSDALASDQLIAMASLEAGWETDYASRPPIASQACLGKIVAHHRLADGRYNLLLIGLERIRIVKELEPLRSFRQARVELVEDIYDFDCTCNRREVRESLMVALRSHLPVSSEAREGCEGIFSGQLPLGALTDLAAYALPISLGVKLELLGESSVRRRAERLLGEIRRLAG